MYISEEEMCHISFRFLFSLFYFQIFVCHCAVLSFPKTQNSAEKLQSVFEAGDFL